jgi:hypothetical protein
MTRRTHTMTPYEKRIWNRFVRAYGLRKEREDADVRVLSRESEDERTGGAQNYTRHFARCELRYHKKAKYLEFRILWVERRYWHQVFREERISDIRHHITVNPTGTVRRMYFYRGTELKAVRTISLRNYYLIWNSKVAQFIMMTTPDHEWIKELSIGFYPISNNELKDIKSLDDFYGFFTGKNRNIPNRLRKALSPEDLLRLIRIVPGEYLNAVALTLKQNPDIKYDEYVLEHIIWAYYKSIISGDQRPRYNAVQSYVHSCLGLGRKLNMRIKSAKRLESEFEKLHSTRRLDRAPAFRTDPKLIMKELNHGEVKLELIKNKKRLGQEAARMKNCVTDYAQEITDGECAIYHVQYRGRPYTMEVIHGPKKTLRLGEVAGLSNRKAPARLMNLLEGVLL